MPVLRATAGLRGGGLADPAGRGPGGGVAHCLSAPCLCSRPFLRVTGGRSGQDSGQERLGGTLRATAQPGHKATGAAAGTLLGPTTLPCGDPGVWGPSSSTGTFRCCSQLWTSTGPCGMMDPARVLPSMPSTDSALQDLFLSPPEHRTLCEAQASKPLPPPCPSVGQPPTWARPRVRPRGSAGSFASEAQCPHRERGAGFADGSPSFGFPKTASKPNAGETDRHGGLVFGPRFSHGPSP